MPALAQKDFLERHPMCLVAIGAEGNRRKGDYPFFVTLAEFAESFALANLRELKEELENNKG